MRVTVVVPTKNSEEFIDRSLVSILNQSYNDIELIVVDNFSTDSTKQRVLHLVDGFLEKGPERTAQANWGIQNSTGEIIYLTGSDMTRDYDFIKKGVEKIKEGFDAIYMSVKTDCEVNHFWGKVKALERESYIGTFIESTRFFKKSVWEELGGFNESLIALEEDFQHRLDNAGYKTGRINEREYHLHEDDSLVKIFKKAFYYGKWTKAYLRRHGKRGYKQLNLIRPNLKVFLKHPLLFGGFIVYKIVQYGGGLCGLLTRS